MAVLLVSVLHYADAEDPAKAPAFEVASITPCKPGTPEPAGEHAGMVQFIYPGGTFRATATTVKFLLEWAYGIQPPQHSGGPSWIDTDRYDIVAKAEGNPTDNQMKQMAQTLLADRFQLKFHREPKKIPAYVLSLGKTAPKLFPPKDGETRFMRIVPQTGPDQKIVAYRVVATRFSLAQLTDTFARQLGRVIVNDTGLDGEYDFTIDLMPDESRPNPVDPSLLISALHDQLGLTVRSQDATVDVLEIDSAAKVAAGN
ncbi:MAG TPA: TIGR03435 family protein [Candidatus Sulfotelmatobacter sp.]|nr:TIGR03435 family protein [Candidatus Sulfotelmatobacter sp.]